MIISIMVLLQLLEKPEERPGKQKENYTIYLNDSQNRLVECNINKNNFVTKIEIYINFIKFLLL